MIIASKARVFTNAFRKKAFKKDLRKINSAIQQAVNRGCTTAVINIDELNQMKEAGFSLSDIFQLLGKILLPLGYCFYISNNYESIYITWRE